MARRPFDNNSGAQVLDPLTGNALSGRSVAFWNAKTGGTQYVDLQDSSGSALPGGVATTDTYGLFALQGPTDGTSKLWADAGYERVLIFSTDVTDRLTSTETTVGVNTTAIAAINAAKGSVNGFASLDLSGRLPQGQLPAGTYRTSWFSVLDYGAVGDGATDDTTAIQNAINAAHAFSGVGANGGGLVYFPSAAYKTTSALTLYSNITILGSGDANTEIHQATAGQDGFNTATNNVKNVVIEKIGVVYTGSASGASSGINFQSSGSFLNQYISIRDVTVTAFRGSGVLIVNPQTVSLVKVNCSNAAIASSNGISLTCTPNIAGNVYLAACQMSNTVTGFNLSGIQSGVIDGCFAAGNTNGIVLTNCQSISVQGTCSSSCVTNAIKINGGSGNTVTAYASNADAGDVIYVTGSAQAVTLNSCIQAGSGATTSFIRTDTGTQVLLQQCAGITANNVAAGTQVSAGVKAFQNSATGNPQTGIGGTTTDITGCSATFTTIGTNTLCVVHGVVNGSIGTGASGVVNLYCNVDGTDQTLTGQTNLITTGSQLDVSQTWLVTLAAAGSHTIKLRAKNSSGQTVNFNNSGNTSAITVLQLTA